MSPQILMDWIRVESKENLQRIIQRLGLKLQICWTFLMILRHLQNFLRKNFDLKFPPQCLFPPAPNKPDFELGPYGMAEYHIYSTGFGPNPRKIFKLEHNVLKCKSIVFVAIMLATQILKFYNCQSYAVSIINNGLGDAYK